MDKKLRQLIGDEAADLLETADSEALDRMCYLVVCETCKHVFYNASLRAARTLFKSAKSSGYMQPLVPFRWYIEACRHFVKTSYVHQITAYVVDGDDKTTVKDLSTEWKAQFDTQKRIVAAKAGNFKEALLNEIDYLQKLADEVYPQA